MTICLELAITKRSKPGTEGSVPSDGTRIKSRLAHLIGVERRMVVVVNCQGEHTELRGRGNVDPWAPGVRSYGVLLFCRVTIGSNNALCIWKSLVSLLPFWAPLETSSFLSHLVTIQNNTPSGRMCCMQMPVPTQCHASFLVGGDACRIFSPKFFRRNAFPSFPPAYMLLR